MQPQQWGRPAGVTLVSIFQFAKATLLVSTAVLLSSRPELVSSPESPLYPLFYIALRGNLEAMRGAAILPGIVLLLGLYLARTAFRLWHLKLGARRTVLFTSGVTLFFWARTNLMTHSSAISLEDFFYFSPERQIFYIMLALDCLVFLYLIRGNTAYSFEA